jgi:hypothetical protein
MTEMRRPTSLTPIAAKANINIDQIIRLLNSDKVREIGLSPGELPED